MLVYNDARKRLGKNTVGGPRNAFGRGSFFRAGHRKSSKMTIDKSKGKVYDCVTRLRTFLKFTGISSQDPKRV